MEKSQKEDSVVFKFNVPRSDYVAAKKIVSMLETELNARIDLLERVAYKAYNLRKRNFRSSNASAKIAHPQTAEILLRLLKA